jgi:Dolichyl-phosphate-mannose-protein mannosyltransferase
VIRYVMTGQVDECALLETRYIPRVRELVRRNLRFFLLFSAAALLWRLLFIFRFPGVVTDSFVYGDIAKNWLQHGIYGLSGPDEISPTYIRLPGYPAFLAFIFAIFGMEHYRAVFLVQMFVDLGTCFICADIALRILGPKYAKIAFVLACLCPFLAEYSAAALTETLEVFFTALTFDLAIKALQRESLRYWAGCGVACAATILLRPDGAILLIVIELYVFARLLFPGGLGSTHDIVDSGRSPEGQSSAMLTTISPAQMIFRTALAPALVAIIALGTLVPWTIRNWNVFHRFQPLAPRYANEEDEFVPMGFNRWVKTWIADYASVEEIYWVVPGGPIDPTKLPSRAFDRPQQRTETVALINDYNESLHVTPELDRRFEALAAARIHAHPARYYFSLPILRIMDMWLRPRTEMLPCDSRWWEFNDDLQWSALAVSLGIANLFYVACMVVGWMYSRKFALAGLLLLFVVLRSGFLGTLENPEPRYTLEMYPIVIVFAACAIAGKGVRDGLHPAKL